MEVSMLVNIFSHASTMVHASKVEWQEVTTRATVPRVFKGSTVRLTGACVNRWHVCNVVISSRVSSQPFPCLSSRTSCIRRMSNHLIDRFRVSMWCRLLRWSLSVIGELLQQCDMPERWRVSLPIGQRHLSMPRGFLWRALLWTAEDEHTSSNQSKQRWGKIWVTSDIL